MYEMKGALSGHSPGSAGFPASRLRVSQSPGLTVPDRLISQPHRPRSTGRPASLFRFVRSPGLPSATRRPPVPGTRCKFRFPGLYIVPGETPGWYPFPAVKTFLRPQPASRKSPSQFILSFFSCPHLVHRIPPVIRTSQRLSTALCTATPQVTRRNSENTSDDRHHNHSVFSRRPSVNPEFLPRPCPSAQPAPAAPRPSGPRYPSPVGHANHIHNSPAPLVGPCHTGRRRPTTRPAIPSPAATPSRATPRPRHTESPHSPVSGRRRPGDGARAPAPAPRNAPENTIARFPASVYHRYMTSRQAPKRPGYMNPAPRLSAALAGEVVAW